VTDNARQIPASRPRTPSTIGRRVVWPKRRRGRHSLLGRTALADHGAAIEELLEWYGAANPDRRLISSEGPVTARESSMESLSDLRNRFKVDPVESPRPFGAWSADVDLRRR
jgi:hypothetical protein